MPSFPDAEFNILIPGYRRFMLSFPDTGVSCIDSRIQEIHAKLPGYRSFMHRFPDTGVSCLASQIQAIHG